MMAISGKMISLVAMAFLFCVAKGQAAEKPREEVIMQGTTVIGNTEFPKVDLDLPWEDSDRLQIRVRESNEEEIPLFYLDRSNLQYRIRLYKAYKKLNHQK